MTLKEELLNINSYEEYIEKRERFRDLQMDEEILNHLDRNIFATIADPFDESICLDVMRSIDNFYKGPKME